MTYTDPSSTVAQTSLRGVAIVLLTTVLFAACGGSPSRADERPLAPTPIPAPAGVDAAGTPLALAVLDGGEGTGLVITDRSGMAVYGTTGETSDNLVCIDDCTAVWIPVQSDSVALPPELAAEKLGSFIRPDGTAQLTYAGVPLYTWTGDDAVGITRGAGVAGTWFALTEVGGFVE